MADTFFIATFEKHLEKGELHHFNTLAIECGCLGIEEFDLEEREVDRILGTDAFSGGVLPDEIYERVEKATALTHSISLYFFESYSHALSFKNEVESTSNHHISIEERGNEDWNALWKESYAPIMISPDLKVVPAFDKKGDSSNEIYINPGMGFGTGGHETTYLCLKTYDELLKNGQHFPSVLDLGTGSGILGIAAIKKERSKVTFCDVDSAALDNCVQNIILNFEGEELQGSEVVARNRLVVKKYDLVFANILLEILKEEVDTIEQSMKQGGVLIVSGILKEQIEELISFYQAKNLLPIAQKTKGDWASILFSKRG